MALLLGLSNRLSTKSTLLSSPKSIHLKDLRISIDFLMFADSNKILRASIAKTGFKPALLLAEEQEDNSAMVLCM